jgi:hypothetical protein
MLVQINKNRIRCLDFAGVLILSSATTAANALGVTKINEQAYSQSSWLGSFAIVTLPLR